MVTTKREPAEAVLLDTNAWVRGTRLLRNPFALAFIHSASRRGSVLLLPEVIEKELHVVMARSCLEAAAQIRKASDDLRSLLSRAVPEIQLPDEKSIANVVNERLAQCADFIERVPLNLMQVRGALERVYNKREPCDRTEEFRDAVVWEVVREWSKTMKVYFVTQDAAFYKKRDFKSGLAESLASDVLGPVLIAQDLSRYLAECGRGAAPLPSRKRVIGALEEQVRDHVHGLDPERTVELNRLKSAELEPFLTEHPKHIVYRFRIAYNGRAWFDDDSTPEACPILVVGEALLDRSMNVLELDLDYIRVGDQPEVPFSYHEEPQRFEQLAPLVHRVPVRGRNPRHRSD